MTAADAVEEMLGRLDYPMVVVTAAAGGERHGCLVGFWTQCSINPIRFLVCVSRQNATYHVARKAAVLGVHVLAAADAEIAALFGGETGDDQDKFARCEWDAGPAGVPLVRVAGGFFVGRVLQGSDVGDHEALLIEPIAGDVGDLDRQLGFQAVKDIEPGHEA